MKKSIFVMMVMVTVLLVCSTGLQATVTMDWVTVGNAGNGVDTTSYGGVSDVYQISTYEVTAGQYTGFLNAVGGVDTYGLYNTNMWSSSYGCKIERYDGTGTSGSPYQYRVAGDYANRPVNYVSWGDSARFSNWLHNNQPTGAQDANTTEDGAYALNGTMTNTELLAVNREGDWKWALTSEDEWYKAAYYKGGGTSAGYWDYPTSSDAVPGRDVADASGNNANYYGSPYPIDSPYYTTVAGGFQNSDSPYGTFDQGGNVWEWNEAVLYGSCRGLRGGSFYGSDFGGDGGYLHASSRIDIGYPAYEDFDVGFRVSEVPEPATMAILMLGGIGILRRRKCARR